MEKLANEVLKGFGFELEVDVATGNAVKINRRDINTLTQDEIDFYGTKLNPTVVRKFIEYKNDRVTSGQEEILLMISAMVLQGAPREVNKAIERAFFHVMVMAWMGQWVSAKEYCEEVVVGGYITQGVKDQILTIITNYINNNY